MQSPINSWTTSHVLVISDGGYIQTLIPHISQITNGATAPNNKAARKRCGNERLAGRNMSNRSSGIAKAGSTLGAPIHAAHEQPEHQQKLGEDAKHFDRCRNVMRERREEHQPTRTGQQHENA